MSWLTGHPLSGMEKRSRLAGLSPSSSLSPSSRVRHSPARPVPRLALLRADSSTDSVRASGAPNFLSSCSCKWNAAHSLYRL